MVKIELITFLNSLKKDQKINLAFAGETSQEYSVIEVRKGRGGSLLATVKRISDGWAREIKSSESAKVDSLTLCPS